MIKILTPTEVVLQCIEKNKLCRDFISSINDALSQVEKPNNGYYSFLVITEEDITAEERELIQKAFNIFGWEISILSTIGEDEDGSQIIENKVVLNKTLPKSGK